jgi:hypothetical protein
VFEAEIKNQMQVFTQNDRTCPWAGTLRSGIGHRPCRCFTDSKVEFEMFAIDLVMLGNCEGMCQCITLVLFGDGVTWVHALGNEGRLNGCMHC